MSAPQGNSACPITVDRPTADAWRLEAKKVLMFNHEPFEDYLDYLPPRQLALADIFRDATAVIDAVGWDPDTTQQTKSIEVPITSSHIQQLHKRRCDLLDTNLDLLEDIGDDAEDLAIIMADIHANRRAVEAINRILNTYTDTITT
ncbi:MAG TPA: hypothetical protein VFY45_17165 [Baekduia sp.]|nr:hypothetical protein [Baekduia sp.]